MQGRHDRKSNNRIHNPSWPHPYRNRGGQERYLKGRGEESLIFISIKCGRKRINKLTQSETEPTSSDCIEGSFHPCFKAIKAPLAKAGKGQLLPNKNTGTYQKEHACWQHEKK